MGLGFLAEEGSALCGLHYEAFLLQWGLGFFAEKDISSAGNCLGLAGSMGPRLFSEEGRGLADVNTRR